jgi:hypothetical protein
MRYFIISQPKAGTYLAANLLRNLSLIPTNIHFTQNDYYLYDPNDLGEGRSNPNKYRIKGSFENSVNLIADDEFGVGHIHYNKKNSRILEPLKKIVIVRSLDGIIESYGRWIRSTGRKENLKGIINTANKVGEWIDQPDTFVLRFEQMVNKDLKVIDQLQRFLFNHIFVPSHEVMTMALMQDSLTKSDIRHGVI